MTREVTDIDKKQIRKYMITLMAAPGLVLTALAALGGYLFGQIEKVTQESLLLETKIQANDILSEIQKNVSNVTIETELSLRSAQQQQKFIETEFERLRTTVDSLDVVKNLEELITNLESKITKSPSFQELIINGLDDLNPRMMSGYLRLPEQNANWATAADNTSSQILKGDVKFPPDYFKRVPIVFASISGLEVQENIDIAIRLSEITKNGFDVSVFGDDGMRYGHIEIQWLALTGNTDSTDPSSQKFVD